MSFFFVSAVVETNDVDDARTVFDGFSANFIDVLELGCTSPKKLPRLSEIKGAIEDEKISRGEKLYWIEREFKNV